MFDSVKKTFDTVKNEMTDYENITMHLYSEEMNKKITAEKDKLLLDDWDSSLSHTNPEDDEEIFKDALSKVSGNIPPHISKLLASYNTEKSKIHLIFQVIPDHRRSASFLASLRKLNKLKNYILEEISSIDTPRYIKTFQGEDLTNVIKDSKENKVFSESIDFLIDELAKYRKISLFDDAYRSKFNNAALLSLGFHINQETQEVFFPADCSCEMCKKIKGRINFLLENFFLSKMFFFNDFLEEFASSLRDSLTNANYGYQDLYIRSEEIDLFLFVASKCCDKFLEIQFHHIPNPPFENENSLSLFGFVSEFFQVKIIPFLDNPFEEIAYNIFNNSIISPFDFEENRKEIQHYLAINGECFFNVSPSNYQYDGEFNIDDFIF